MATYWGAGAWALGGWGGGVVSDNLLIATAKHGTLVLQNGGILNIAAERSVLSIAGIGGSYLNVLAMTAKRGTLIVSGLNGTIGDFILSAERGALSLSGFNSTLETLNIVADRKSTRLNSSHIPLSRMPSSA